MRQTIYIDVLIGINLFANYFLLLASAKLLGRHFKRWRGLLGAGVGAVYSLVILLPLPAFLSFLGKVAVSAAIVRIVFAWEGPYPYFKMLASFYLASFALAGIMLGIWFLFMPNGIVVHNSVVYFNIPPLLFLIITVICYGILRFIQHIAGRKAPKDLDCRVEIFLEGRKSVYTARIDTGNALVEPFSGYPVLVVDEDKGEPLPMPPAELCRVVPFHTVSGDGLLMGFKPDKVLIFIHNRMLERKNLYIAVSKTPISSGEYQALLNPMLLD